MRKIRFRFFASGGSILLAVTLACISAGDAAAQIVAWGAVQGTVPTNLNTVAVGAGGWHSLALQSNGTVAAWGLDDHGQTDVPAGLTNVVQVVGGAYFSLVLRS